MTPDSVTPGSVRRCGFCESSLEGRDPRARYCDSRCRAAAHKERTSYGPQAPREVRSNANPAATKASRMRERREQGLIVSDKRISFARAVDAGVRLVRQVAYVPEADARVLAEREMAQALPSRWQSRAVSGSETRRAA